MSFWSRLGGGKSKSEQKRLDYLSEGLALERQGDYEAALTSYQLALRDQPTNHRVLQNMAIAYSRTGRQTEAIPLLPPRARHPAETVRRPLRPGVSSPEARRHRRRGVPPRVIPDGSTAAQRRSGTLGETRERDTRADSQHSSRHGTAALWPAGEYPEVSE